MSSIHVEYYFLWSCTEPSSSYQVDVNGSNATPLYKFLKSSKGGLFGDSIKWNFSKFLVDKEGRVVDRYAPTTSPLSIEVNLQRQLFSKKKKKLPTPHFTFVI